ncbi:hypothetical protein [Desulfosoma sp.]
MRRGAQIFVVCCIAVFLGTWARCQDEVIVFEKGGGKAVQRPAVSFPHETHA